MLFFSCKDGQKENWNNHDKTYNATNYYNFIRTAEVNIFLEDFFLFETTHVKGLCPTPFMWIFLVIKKLLRSYKFMFIIYMYRRESIIWKILFFFFSLHAGWCFSCGQDRLVSHFCGSSVTGDSGPGTPLRARCQLQTRGRLPVKNPQPKQQKYSFLPVNEMHVIKTFQWIQVIHFITSKYSVFFWVKLVHSGER